MAQLLNTTINGKLTVGQADLYNGKTLYVNGSTWINSDLGVNDGINAKDAHLRDRLTIYPNTNSHYNSKDDSGYKLFVDGDSKIYGNEIITNNLTVGDSSINSNYKLYINGDSKIVGNSLITDYLEIGSGSPARANEKLFVRGSGTFTNSLTVIGDFNNTNGSSTINNLHVKNNTKIDESLDVEKDITTDNLVVAGTSNLNDTVNINTNMINLVSNTSINIDENVKIDVEIESIEGNNTIIFNRYPGKSTFNNTNTLIIKEKNKNNIIESCTGSFTDTYDSKTKSSLIPTGSNLETSFNQFFNSNNYIKILYIVKVTTPSTGSIKKYSISPVIVSKMGTNLPFSISCESNINDNGLAVIRFVITSSTEFLNFVKSFEEYNYFKIGDSFNTAASGTYFSFTSTDETFSLLKTASYNLVANQSKTITENIPYSSFFNLNSFYKRKLVFINSTSFKYIDQIKDYNFLIKPSNNYEDNLITIKDESKDYIYLKNNKIDINTNLYANQLYDNNNRVYTKETVPKIYNNKLKVIITPKSGSKNISTNISTTDSNNKTTTAKLEDFTNGVFLFSFLSTKQLTIIESNNCLKLQFKNGDNLTDNERNSFSFIRGDMSTLKSTNIYDYNPVVDINFSEYGIHSIELIKPYIVTTTLDMSSMSTVNEFKYGRRYTFKGQELNKNYWLFPWGGTTNDFTFSNITTTGNSWSVDVSGISNISVASMHIELEISNQQIFP